MLAFLEGLDPGSRMFRFFSGGTDLDGRGPSDGGRRLRAALRPGRGSGSERRGGRAGELLRRLAPGRGGDCVRDRRRTAGARAWDAPPRPSGRGRAGERDLGLHRGGDAGEPPDDRGLSRERLPGRDVVAPRLDPRGAADLVLRRGRLPFRGPRPDRRASRDPPLPRTPGGRRDRRLARARDGRRPALPQRAGGGLRGRGLPGEPLGRGGAVGARLPEHHRGAGRGRPRRDRRPCPRRDRRCARVRGQGGPGARRDLRRLRRDRARWRRAPGPAGRGLQGGGDATGRARTASGS